MNPKFVIIGGGTAGWLVANIIRSFVKPETRITLVESPKIPTVGVGEGTTNHFWFALNYWCPWLKENEFIRETNATFKLGSRFEDWTHEGSWYTTPNDAIGHPPECDTEFPPSFDSMRAYAVANELSVNPSIQDLLINNSRAPYIYGKSNGHGFHFDAYLALKFFHKRAKIADIEHVIGTVKSVNRQEDGKVLSLVFDDDKTLEGDIFVDCTGFLRLLPKILNVKFNSWKDYILVDRAINFPIPIKDNEDIPSYTLAKAMDSGWLWRIPTYERYGSGYIFSSSFLNTDQAFDVLKQKYGIESYIQEIKFETGALESGWSHNVLFSGLCAGFIEPMESTSLHSSICNLVVFLKEFYRPDMNMMDTNLQHRYNDLYWKPYWESVRDWIVLHYQTGRNDTEFWRAANAVQKPDSLKSKLELWEYRMPRVIETSNKDQIWQHSLVYSVANGLNLLNKEVAQKELDYYGLNLFGKKVYEKYSSFAKEQYKGSRNHREVLKEIRR
jgi:tryptophan halogenase